ncbi:ap-3 complex subunit sigma-1 [Lynx pardinus]|uniref:Ap-3 complex subunit sigma-1 n=1 Tax=Lynx pardinus TaxID=191816 RepID=A0A485NR07_LYNPA|nr:ap-3 complex subunit sigma-1 [Lynx pardinus]
MHRRGPLASPSLAPSTRQVTPAQPSHEQALLVLKHRKQWLCTLCLPCREDPQQQTIREIFRLPRKEDENVCSFLEGGSLQTDVWTQGRWYACRNRDAGNGIGDQHE